MKAELQLDMTNLTVNGRVPPLVFKIAFKQKMLQIRPKMAEILIMIVRTSIKLEGAISALKICRLTFSDVMPIHMGLKFQELGANYTTPYGAVQCRAA
uniref:Uncharacterized protein n=1 Tax=Romanomermis culicivorax TaxID=13658 RepID=A0A915LB90_ROMCU